MHRPHSSFLRTALILGLVLAVASPSLAYTIYLKDGNRMVAREKYRVEGDRAYFTMQNGTRTYLPLSEIDVERTAKANEKDVGTAMVLEGGKVQEVPIEDVQRRSRKEHPTLRDLITRGDAGPSSLSEPEATEDVGRRDTNEPSAAELPRTRAGYVDLGALDMKCFDDPGIVSQLRDLYARRELDDVEVYRGTNPHRPLVEVVTGSEAGVFRAIAVSAIALLQLQEQDPNRIEAVELLLTTPSGARAGQFVITPDSARELLGREIDVTSFFLRHVQF
jgi:hypothetical protein